MKVIQSIIIHDAIGRPKIVLDQLREGLAILGFGAEMQKSPDIFQPLFVLHDHDPFKGSDVIRILKFPTMNDEETTIKSYLLEFLTKAGNSDLKNFLIFATGAPVLPEFGLGHIGIKFDSIESIFASTCLKEITFPKSFPDEETFFSSIIAVINTEARSFNCV